MSAGTTRYRRRVLAVVGGLVAQRHELRQHRDRRSDLQIPAECGREIPGACSPGPVRRRWSEAEDQRRQPQRSRPAAHRLLPLCTRVRPERARTRAASTSSRRQDRVEPAAEWTTVGSPVYGRLRWSWRVQLRPNTNCARVAAANLTDAGETLSAAQVQFAVEPRDLGRVWRRWEVQGRLGEAAETYETADMRAEALRNSCNARGSRSRPFVQRAGGDVNPSRNSYCQQEE